MSSPINIDEYLRRLIEPSDDLSAKEQRAVVEDMSEEELAILDLLTKPEPVLDAKVQAVFDRVATSYGDDGSTVYEGEGTVAPPAPGRSWRRSSSTR